MSNPVMKSDNGAIAYECEFIIDTAAPVLGSGTRLKFKGYASAEMMRELAGSIYFLTHQRKDGAKVVDE